MRRTLTPELMDDPAIPEAVHRKALHGLSRLNGVCGVTSSLWPYLEDPLRRSGGRISLLDVASGSSDVPIRLAQRARRHGREIRLSGCDVSAFARRMALEQAHAADVDMDYHTLDVTRDSFEDLGRHDVVMCNLFLHHLEEEAAAHVIRESARAAKQLLIISDLRRDWQHVMLAATFPRLLTRSRVVHVDAVKSVRAAYSVGDLDRLATMAGLHDAQIRKVFPKRMVLAWSPR